MPIMFAHVKGRGYGPVAEKRGNCPDYRSSAWRSRPNGSIGPGPEREVKIR